ncbi:MAG: PSD1 domain-containing protein [Planctomycetaceae bacterium]|nr:PSD1 domain-containing protein [Planctomycetaceae bacterium]
MFQNCSTLWISTLRVCLLLLTVITFSDKEPLCAEENNAFDFERNVRLVFATKCLKCHGADEPEADLNLTIRESGIEGGQIVPGNPAESTLIERLTTNDDDLRMPPEGERLTAAEIHHLKNWIEAGAPWPTHWAYQPLQEPNLPTLSSAELETWCQTPIDQFIAAQLEQAGLTPSSVADRVTLIRRASFDLTGLPPTPEEVDDFINDTATDAWEKVVNRLLASPHYGERWARHWMDLVHYAETHGHDQDRPREHAWPYRDYLIRSFNQDKPYAQFVQEQIAGDILTPYDPTVLTATGFLSAGPWDESSLRDIQEGALDRIKGQYLDRDDIVTTVMSTFNSTSIHCARCHDHKFDPISQTDYYGLQSVFAGIEKANRAYDGDPQTALRRQQLLQQKTTLEETFNGNPEQLLTAENLSQLKTWESEYRTRHVLWEPLTITRSESTEGATLEPQPDHSILVSGTKPETDIYHLHGTSSLTHITAIRLEVLPHESLPSRGPGRAENGNLHLNEVRLFATEESNDAERELTLTSPFADFNQEGWTIEMAVDRNPDTAWGIHPEEGKPHFAIFPLSEPTEKSNDQYQSFHLELQQIHGRGHLIGCFRISVTDAPVDQLREQEAIPLDLAQIIRQDFEARSPTDQARLIHWFLLNQLDSELAALPSQQLVYCGTNTFEKEGHFAPPSAPRKVHVLYRGLATEPREEATPGALRCLESLPGDLSINSIDDEGARRVALAHWLASPQNPLTWRSIANRVWLYHFGQGLVETPNDFGQMGAAPSHPELLDWLAVTLQKENGSLKTLHRLILTSAVYQQQSSARPEEAAIDAGNRLLWRMNRRRLDAESFRDALLSISGTLDPTMGGPSVKQFIQTKGIHVTPNVDYLNFDIDDPANYRRSVYRFIFRTIPDPFMESLDCPDASQLTPQRNVSLTALQALATLNDKFVIRQSELLAENLQSQADAPEEQITLLWQRLYHRNPASEELASVLAYTEKHGLANTCRFLFNTNEFLFVD